MFAQHALFFWFASQSAAATCKLRHGLASTCFGPPGVYHVEPSPGKGLGVFATHDLEIGDIVMRETPILKIQRPALVKGAGYPMTVVSNLVRAEFETLSPDEQAEVLSLIYHHSNATDGSTVDKLGAIFKTNAYNTGEQLGLFPKIARINHSCRPNTSYYWSEKLNKRIVYATRKIEQGEEFSVSYISLLLHHKERQKYLNHYGFKCRCEACAQGHADMEISDERRVSIKNAFTAFETEMILERPKSEAAIQQARNNAKASLQLAELVHQEGLADYYAKAYKIVAVSHGRVGEWDTAAIWANKGYELKFMEDPESPFTLELHYLTSTFISSWEDELRDRSLAHKKP